MLYEQIRTDLPALAEVHDDRHRLSDEPHAREAVVFMFELPDQGLAGFVYTWVDKAGLAGSAVCVFGPALDQPIQERLELVAIPADMTFRNWDVGGTRVQLGEPHRSVDVSFAGQRVTLEFRYEAMHPVYAFSFHEDGCPAYYADDRTEQHGRGVGTLTIDGQAYPFDSYIQRDHSWGNRVWGLNQHYKWFHATTESACVHFFELQSFGKAKVRGFVVKDGRMAQIRDLDYSYTFDSDMHHETIDVTVVDDDGRTTAVKSKVFAKFLYEVDPMILLKEGATTVELDGASGTGWCEFCWNKNYHDFAQQFSTKFA